MVILTPTKNTDPRVKRTRQLLQQALMGLMQEKKFASISVQDIAGRATVNRATFYAHFEDKYDLLNISIRDQFQEILDSKLPATSRWDKKSLRALMKITLDYFHETHRHECKRHEGLGTLIERAAQQALNDHILVWLEQERGSIDRRISPETIASVVSWTIFGMATQWKRTECTIPVGQVIDQTLAILLKGVGRLSPTLLLE